MLTVIFLLGLLAILLFVLIKSGKIADKNGNNIPDIIEEPVVKVVQEVKQVVEKPIAKVVKAADSVVKAKKPKKSPAKKTSAKKK